MKLRSSVTLPRRRLLTEERLATKPIYKGHIINVRVDTIRKPDGEVVTRDIVEHGPVIAVVALDADDNLLMVRQYRTPIGKTLLEIPAGGIDPGEDPETAVGREMQEETGYRPNKIKRLGGFYSAPGFCTEYLHLYLATGLTPGRLHAEDTDSIELVRVQPHEIEGLIGSGAICDAKSIAGLLYYLKYRQTA